MLTEPLWINQKLVYNPGIVQIFVVDSLKKILSFSFFKDAAGYKWPFIPWLSFCCIQKSYPTHLSFHTGE